MNQVEERGVAMELKGLVNQIKQLEARQVKLEREAKAMRVVARKINPDFDFDREFDAAYKSM